MQKGDIAIAQLLPDDFEGYYTALERTLFLDHASDEHLRIWEINCGVHRRGLKLLKPGARCGDVATEADEIYRSHNLLGYRSFGYGHSFGVLSHYYGREAGVELREDINTVLQPGMVVSMEPMLTIPEGLPGAGGYREHDILVMTEDGRKTSPSSRWPEEQHRQGVIADCRDFWRAFLERPACICLEQRDLIGKCGAYHAQHPDRPSPRIHHRHRPARLYAGASSAAHNRRSACR